MAREEEPVCGRGRGAPLPPGVLTTEESLEPGPPGPTLRRVDRGPWEDPVLLEPLHNLNKLQQVCVEKERRWNAGADPAGSDPPG